MNRARALNTFKGHKILVFFISCAFLMSMLLISVFYWKFQPKFEDSYEIASLPSDVLNSLNAKHAGSQVAPAKTFRIPIVLYHYVEYVKDQKDTIRQSLNIPPSIFDQQIKTLADNGFTSITMSDVQSIIDGKMQAPAKPIVLTFDDGYRDFYTDAFPIIKKYGAKTVAYVVPGFLNKQNNLDEWQLKEIVKSGLVEIGAHTVHHVFLKGMTNLRAFSEISDSKKMLETELGFPIQTFAYPYGAFDMQTIKLVSEAGFKNAVSTVFGFDANVDNKYFLYRIRPGYRTGKDLIDYIQNGK